LVESGWLTIVKAHIALYADRDPPQARRHAQARVAIGQAIGSREVEMLALAYEGLALVSDGLVTEGMGKLDESSTAAISGELRGGGRGRHHRLLPDRRVRAPPSGASGCASSVNVGRSS
jgi:hypothetical protein